MARVTMQLAALVALALLGLAEAVKGKAAPIPGAQQRVPKWFKRAMDRVWFREKEESHLIEFYSIPCDHCDDMIPVMISTMRDLGVKIRRIMVSEGTREFRFMSLLDRDSQCGGLPYFYNTKTHKAICGATTEKNFKAWALGTDSQQSAPPPIEDMPGLGQLLPTQEEQQAKEGQAKKPPLFARFAPKNEKVTAPDSSYIDSYGKEG